MVRQRAKSVFMVSFSYRFKEKMIKSILRIDKLYVKKKRFAS